MVAIMVDMLKNTIRVYACHNFSRKQHQTSNQTFGTLALPVDQNVPNTEPFPFHLHI